jgi:hypothetical protein
MFPKWAQDDHFADHFAGFQVIAEASGANWGAPSQRIPFPLA